MSYNGIGLSTARGTGTNGYIQRNLSHSNRREGVFEGRQRYERERDRGYRISDRRNVTDRVIDQSILEHNKKREVESKCFDLRVKLEDQGVDEAEIVKQIEELRKRLIIQTQGSTRKHREHQIHEQSAAKVEANKRLESALEKHNEGTNRRWRGRDWRHTERPVGSRHDDDNTATISSLPREGSSEYRGRRTRHERSVSPVRRRETTLSPSHYQAFRDGSVTPPRRRDGRDDTATRPPQLRESNDGSLTPPRKRRYARGDSISPLLPPKNARDDSFSPPPRRNARGRSVTPPRRRTSFDGSVTPPPRRDSRDGSITSATKDAQDSSVIPIEPSNPRIARGAPEGRSSRVLRSYD